MKKPICLFYARKDVGGGSTSFAVHLHRAMEMAGYDVAMYRFCKDPLRKKETTLAEYEGVVPKWVTPEEARALVQNYPSLLVGPEHSKNLPEDGLLPELARLKKKALRAPVARRTR